MNMTETVKLYDIDPDGARHMAQKLHRKKEDIEVVRKYFTSEKSEADSKERSVVSYISTGIKDRDGEVLEPSGVVLDNYRKNPIVMYAHDYRSVPVGKNIWIKQDEKGLIAKTMFANTEFADQIYQLYSEDIGGTGPVMKAFSVGFIPIEWEDIEQKSVEDPRRIYKKWELLEYSCVPVPSCPEALALAYEKGVITSDRLKKDFGVGQSITTTNAPGNETAKILDAENNPSTQDIIMAINTALNPPQEKPSESGAPPVPWYSVNEIFPVDFPSGHCIFTEYLPGRDVQPSYRQDYTFSDGRAAMTGERVEVVVAYREKSIAPITKPETTENYIHIPVSTGHDKHEIKTITISADEGIKALYCVPCKEIETYLFDVDKWTMAEAQAWVDEHKEGKVGKFEMTVTLSDELQGELEFLRETIESMKAMLPVPSENDSESLKAFIGEVKEEVRAVGENVAELMVTVEGMKAPVISIESVIPGGYQPNKGNLDSANPPQGGSGVPPPAREPEDIGAIVREVMAELDFKAILNTAIKVELAKLRGRVE